MLYGTIKPTDDCEIVLSDTEEAQTAAIAAKTAELEAAGNLVVNVEKLKMMDYNAPDTYVSKVYYRSVVKS